MTNSHFTADNSSDSIALIEPYRQELYLHCYRLMGSLYDAEDQVQETMLRAWQRFETFRGTASLRTWLYTIATHTCLDALKKRPPRTLPMAIYPVSDPKEPVAPATTEILWLEPFPNIWLEEMTYDPETHYTRYESISLAFLSALQLLPPRQRAILILSDVLDWRANEIAPLLEISVSAVNSALHRARATLAKNYHRDEREITQVSRTDTAINTLLERYMRVWETDDVAGLVALLKEDATLNMPPVPSWYQGRESIRALLISTAFGSGVRHLWRLYPTEANDRPAFALYRANPEKGFYQAFGIQVLTLDASLPDTRIATVTSFHLPELVASFGFPPQMS